MGNVRCPLQPDEVYLPLTTSWLHSWVWEERCKVRRPPRSCVCIALISTTSSVIIQEIIPLRHAGSAHMAYFYFDSCDTAKQDSRALVSSLLFQLSNQSAQFRDVLRNLYSEHQIGSEMETPTYGSLAQCLKDMVSVVTQVPLYLIVDALDQCTTDSVLDLVEELVELRGHHPNLRLCITSRPEFDIRTVLGPLATQQISLHDENGQKEDIIYYVSSVVGSDERMKKWPKKVQDMVVEKFAEKADGMYGHISSITVVSLILSSAGFNGFSASWRSCAIVSHTEWVTL